MGKFLAMCLRNCGISYKVEIMLSDFGAFLFDEWKKYEYEFNLKVDSFYSSNILNSLAVDA